MIKSASIQAKCPISCENDVKPFHHPHKYSSLRHSSMSRSYKRSTTVLRTFRTIGDTCVWLTIKELRAAAGAKRPTSKSLHSLSENTIPRRRWRKHRRRTCRNRRSTFVPDGRWPCRRELSASRSSVLCPNAVDGGWRRPLRSLPSLLLLPGLDRCPYELLLLTAIDSEAAWLLDRLKRFESIFVTFFLNFTRF